METVEEGLIKELPLDLRSIVYENIARKDYTQRELARIQKKIRDSEALDEQGKRTDLKEDSETSTQIGQKSQGVYKKLGNLFGESHNSVRKRISVYEAAKDDPDEYGDLEEKMEDSLHSAHRELRRRREAKEREEKLKNAPELKNLILGDCLEKIEKVPDGSIDCVVTDPPYGIETITGARSETCELRDSWTYDGDDERIFPLLTELFGKLKPKLKADAHIYIFTSWKAWHELYPVVDEFFDVKNWLVYLHYLATAGDLYVYRTAASSVMFATHGNGRTIHKHKWNFFDERGNYRADGRIHHPAQKSVSICKKLIGNSTVEGETVLDPFCGSGSTLVAAEELGRNWIGIELEERWHDVARSRIMEI